MDQEHLKTRQRAERHTHRPNLALRVHRALSWLRRAEQPARNDDLDGPHKRIETFVWNEFTGGIRVLLDHPEALWGDACYPVVEMGK